MDKTVCERSDHIQNIIAELREILPKPMFPIGYLKNVVAVEAPQTIRNFRCQHLIPEECFIHDGGRVMIVTEPFLAWKATRIKPDRFKSKKSNTE
jgi:hypothetical protein